MLSRLPIEKLFTFAMIALFGYLTSDLSLLWIRSSLYPQQPPPPERALSTRGPMARSNYAVIKDRNIFNADGLIPPARGEGNGTAPKGSQEIDPEPVPTTLPLALLGTIVHANPHRSVASLNLKSKNETVAVKVGDVIPDDAAEVLKVERNKVIFRNRANRRREYVELKDESKINFGAVKTLQQQGEVTVLNDNTREIKRADVDRLTNNLPELLQQARAVPRLGPNGMIECFSIADIQPGSIYERLGLKRNDCIKSVNGEKIDSPVKAMELYNALRSSAETINLGVERGGRDDNFQFNITR